MRDAVRGRKREGKMEKAREKDGDCERETEIESARGSEVLAEERVEEEAENQI